MKIKEHAIFSDTEIKLSLNLASEDDKKKKHKQKFAVFFISDDGFVLEVTFNYSCWYIFYLNLSRGSEWG